ncbi:MAG: 16S rRNA (adenine(1518)-N(6)/adenine(1519)-N(6))-dimethyltransferase RsmA [Mycoplasmataceae bacterium]|nr:16S rRNA (adenine(1518)-N(6)/adenine(1519)-N(6))-dimethyltransferase RsmA [Mycoplasmataceae bacterium]
MNETKNFISSTKFNPSKKMGQNFLIDESFSKSLIDNIDFSDVDYIIEIGPGLGAITKFLSEKNISMTAIELDKRLQEGIKKNFPQINVINDDCLNIDYDSVFAKYKNPIIISNLPYSISTLMINKFLRISRINTMYCMLQKEVVERMKGKISTKQYNNFSISCQFYSNIDILKKVDRKLFFPIPEVDSLFIKIKKKEMIYDENFVKFLKLSFLQRRKTLINNLKNKYDTKLISNWLGQNKFSLNCRAEEINPNLFFNFYNSLINTR